MARVARGADTDEAGASGPLAFVHEAHQLCDQGRAAEAEALSREGLLRAPGLAPGQVALGRALALQERLGEAQDVLLAAVRANAQDPQALRWLGAVVLRRGDPERARALFAYANALRPGDPDIERLLREATEAVREEAPALDEGDPTVVVPDAGRLGETEDPTAIAVPTLAARTFSARAARLQQDAALSVVPAAEPNPLSAALSPWPEAHRVSASPRPAAPPLLSPRGALSAWRQWWRRIGPVRGTVALVASGVALALTVVLARSPGRPLVTPDPEADALRISFRAGDVPALEARLARLESATAAAGPEARALAALAAAWLRYAYGFSGDATALLARAHSALGSAGGPPSTSAALVAAARALLEATGSSVPQPLDPPPAGTSAWEAALATGLAALERGDTKAAREALEPAVAREPNAAPLVLAWSQFWLDQGEPTTAVASLRAHLERSPGDLAARVLLADAERTGAVRPQPGAVQALDTACANAPSAWIRARAACRLDAAERRRLSGDRAGAAAAARELLDEPDASARLRARAVLLLADLGEVAAAERGWQVVRAAPTLVEVDADALPSWARWAHRAVQVATGVRVEAPVVGVPPNELAWLVALRDAYQRNGGAALGRVLRTTAALDGFDPDVRALGALSDEPLFRRSDREAVAQLADQGNPVAAAVSGRIARLRGDLRPALRWLETGSAGHAWACATAAELLTTARQLGRGLTASPTLRVLRQQHPSCPSLAAR